MNTLTLDLSREESSVSPAASGVSGLRIALTVSILLGPLAWLVCRAISDRFTGSGQGWILLACCVIGFELVWLTYGLIVLVRKGLATL